MGDSAGKALKFDWPFRILLIFFAFEYIRFQDSYLPFVKFFKIPSLTVLFLAIFLIKSDKAPLKTTMIGLVAIFILEVVLWVPFATNNFHAFQASKTMLMTFVTVCATVVFLSDMDRIKAFFRSWVFINLLVCLWIIKSGGTGTGGFLEDENDACLALVGAFPFAWYLLGMSENGKWTKRVCLGLLILIPLAVMYTSSRGGLVGFVAVVFWMLLWSRNALRNLMISAVLALTIGGATIALLPSDYVEDMQSISDQEDDTRMLRFLHWTTSYEMFKANPVFGVGPANYPWDSWKYFSLSPYYVEGSRDRSGRQSHSLYFTLIPELGLVGIVLFVSLTLIGLKNVLALRRQYLKKSLLKVNDESPEMAVMREDVYRIASAIGAAVVGFLITSVFISTLYYPVFWHLVGFLVALLTVAKKQRLI